MRRVLADYNADRRDLFAAGAWDEAVAAAAPSDADRVSLMAPAWPWVEEQVAEVGRRLKEFAPAARRGGGGGRLRTILGVGPVTVDVVS